MKKLLCSPIISIETFPVKTCGTGRSEHFGTQSMNPMVSKICKIKNQEPLINAILLLTGKKFIGSKQDEIFKNNEKLKSGRKWSN